MKTLTFNTKSLRPTIFGDTLKGLDQFFVGFDDQFNRLDQLYSDVTKNIPSYPPYNIRKVTDTEYRIEIAVAGFDQSEIDIELEEGSKLIVKGSSKDESADYMYKGIAKRDFTRTFILNDEIIVKGADIVNGMLTIDLERIIPEEKKPRKIVIGTAQQSVPQLLQEATQS